MCGGDNFGFGFGCIFDWMVFVFEYCIGFIGFFWCDCGVGVFDGVVDCYFVVDGDIGFFVFVV